MSAIPFIQVDPSDPSGSRFIVHPQAIELLQRLRGPVAPVVVAGLYRSGKSTLLNMLVHRTAGGTNTKKAAAASSGFAVGGTINACTRGLWLWSEAVQVNGRSFLFIDSEGLGSTQENANFDVQIFTLSVLLASLFILNSVGTITEAALEQLELVLELSKHIRLSDDNTKNSATSSSSSNGSSGGSGSSGSLQELSAHFPVFLWVLRDFVLELISKEGAPLTATQYLEGALQPHASQRASSAEKNRIRTAITSAFPQRDCVVLVRPITDESQLQKLNSLPTSALRPEFVTQVNSLRERIVQRTPSKTLNGVELNGSAYLQLAQFYVAAMNGGRIPSIASAWTSVLERQASDVLQRCEQLYRERVQQLLHADERAIVAESALQSSFAQLDEQARELIHTAMIGDAQHKLALVEQLRTRVDPVKAEAQRINALRSSEQCRQVMDAVWAKHRLDEQLEQVNDANDLHARIEAIQAEYNKQARGPAAERIGRDFLQSKQQSAMRSLFARAQREREAAAALQKQLRDEVAAAAQYKQQQQHAMHELQLQAQKLTVQLESGGAELARTHAALQQEQAAHRATQAEANKQLAAQQQKGGARVAELEAAQQRSSARVSELEATQQRSSARVIELEAAQQRSSARVSELETALAAAERKLVQADSELKTQRANAKQLSTRAEAAEKGAGKVAAAEERAAAAERQRDAATTQSEQSAFDLAALQDSLAAQKVETAKANAQHVAQISALQAQIEHLTHDLSTARAQATEAAAAAAAAANNNSSSISINSNGSSASESDERKRKTSSRSTLSGARGSLASSASSGVGAGAGASAMEDDVDANAPAFDGGAEEVSASAAADDENDDSAAPATAPYRPRGSLAPQPLRDPNKLTIQELRSWLTSLDVEFPVKALPKASYVDLMYTEMPELETKYPRAATKGKSKK